MIAKPTDLSGLLLGLQGDFAWPRRAHEYLETSNWERERSGSSFHRLDGQPDGPDVVVKAMRGWSADDAKSAFAAMVDLADTFDDAHIDGASAIRPWAWAAEPPLLVMPFVEGADLIGILRDPDSPAWNIQISEWIARAGVMLAAYHRGHPAPESVPGARAEVEELARRFRVRRSFEIDWEHRVATAFGDFGPGNLHAHPDGHLYLLDPPISPRPAVVHRDLANFLFELRRQLAGQGFTSTPAVHGRYEGLSSTFLDGYSIAASMTIDSPDRALIALYETRRAIGMARKRFPNRLGDAIWFGRTAVSLRRTARSR